MTERNKRSPAHLALSFALLASAFELGRGLARVERGEAFFPALPLPAYDTCCAISASLTLMLA